MTVFFNNNTWPDLAEATVVASTPTEGLTERILGYTNIVTTTLDGLAVTSIKSLPDELLKNESVKDAILAFNNSVSVNISGSNASLPTIVSRKDTNTSIA